MAKSSLSKRRRGVILSTLGWQRLQTAEQQSELQDNHGKPYTLEELSHKTSLSLNTLTKVRHRRVAVDRQTLACYFRAFGLPLRVEDYTVLDGDPAISSYQLAPLDGPVPLDSLFYIERPPVETWVAEAIAQPGGLTRIQAPRKFGKTSLLARAIAQAHEQGYRTVILNLKLADTSVLQDLQRFLQWFCFTVTHSLDLPNQLEAHWQTWGGSSSNCTHYFEHYLLTSSDTPLVLALDDVDSIFNTPELAADFLGMLRIWSETAKYGNGSSAAWRQLRLILAYDTARENPFSWQFSPSWGAYIDLAPFNLEQIHELSQRHGLNQSSTWAESILEFTGGHPYLTQLTLQRLSQTETTLNQLHTEAIATDPAFMIPLRDRLVQIQQFPALLSAMQRVVMSPIPVDLPPTELFQLQNLGLVQIRNHQAVPCCQLYRQFFSRVLATLLPAVSQIPTS